MAPWYMNLLGVWLKYTLIACPIILLIGLVLTSKKYGITRHHLLEGEYLVIKGFLGIEIISWENPSIWSLGIGNKVKKFKAQDVVTETGLTSCPSSRCNDSQEDSDYRLRVVCSIPDDIDSLEYFTDNIEFDYFDPDFDIEWYVSEIVSEATAHIPLVDPACKATLIHGIEDTIEKKVKTALWDRGLEIQSVSISRVIDVPVVSGIVEESSSSGMVTAFKIIEDGKRVQAQHRNETSIELMMLSESQRRDGGLIDIDSLA